jgi:hypothetical protein
MFTIVLVKLIIYKDFENEIISFPIDSVVDLILFFVTFE